MKDLSRSARHAAGALLALSAFLASVSLAHAAPTLWGYTGLINIPTADLVPDGRAIVGLGYVQRPYGLSRRPTHDNATYFASVGFFPFLELHLRVVRISGDILDYKLPGYGSDKDRSVAVRVRLTRGNGWGPALVLGIHDPGLKKEGSEEISTGEFSACYVVGSKSAGPVRAHLGYSTDWLSDRTPHFSGLFGGLEYAFARWLTAAAEHDTRKTSAGLRFVLPLPRPFPGSGEGRDGAGTLLGCDIVSLGMKKLSGSVYLEFGL